MENFIIILIFLGITLFATHISRIEKKVNVSLVSASISLPLGYFSALGTTMLLFLVFKGFLLLVVFILLLITKLKFILGAKIVAMITAFAASVFGVFVGPPGWIILIILTIYFFGAIKEYTMIFFKSINEWFFEKLSAALIKVRTHADYTRDKLSERNKFLVLFIEVPIVCGVSSYSLWELLSISENFFIKGSPSEFLILLKFVCLIPFTYFMYKAYLRDTTPPKKGGDGLDVPVPLQAESLISTNPS